MKLRIKGNSVRLRLTKSEVAQFARTAAVEENVDFGSESLIYALESSDDIESPRAVFENNRITILLPKSQANEWTQTNLVGIRGEQPTGDGKFFTILVEKDFACLQERPGEDDTDAFPNEPAKIC